MLLMNLMILLFLKNILSFLVIDNLYHLMMHELKNNSVISMILKNCISILAYHHEVPETFAPI
jgi:S-adenosylmethionine/arginine decarboxylase-like enzyme